MKRLLARGVHSIFYLGFLKRGILFRKLISILGLSFKWNLSIFILDSRDYLGSKGGLMPWIAVLIGGVDVSVRLIGFGFY